MNPVSLSNLIRGDARPLSDDERAAIVSSYNAGAKLRRDRSLDQQAARHHPDCNVQPACHCRSDSGIATTRCSPMVFKSFPSRWQTGQSALFLPLKLPRRIPLRAG